MSGAVRLVAGVSLMVCAALTLADEDAQRWYAPQHADAGKAIYLARCAACHGLAGEGAPQWWQLERDGNRLAPPLNGTGHGWHHPLRQLYAMIHDGIPPAMPAWKGILDRGEILAVIAYFQNWWPDEVYKAWKRMNDAEEKTAAD